MVAIYKALEEDHMSEEMTEFITRVAKCFISDVNKSLKSNTFSNSLMAHPSANKILKSILLLGHECVDYYCDQVAQIASVNM